MFAKSEGQWRSSAQRYVDRLFALRARPCISLLDVDVQFPFWFCGGSKARSQFASSYVSSRGVKAMRCIIVNLLRYFVDVLCPLSQIYAAGKLDSAASWR